MCVNLVVFNFNTFLQRHSTAATIVIYIYLFQFGNLSLFTLLEVIMIMSSNFRLSMCLDTKLSGQESTNAEQLYVFTNEAVYQLLLFQERRRLQS